MKGHIKYRLCIQDICLIGAVLVGSFWALWAFSNAPAETGGRLIIHQDGQVLREAALDRNETLNLSVHSGRMSIEIDPVQGVRVAHSDCPAHICMHTGWIIKTGQTIICLPNKMLLEITGAGEEEYNAIAY